MPNTVPDPPIPVAVGVLSDHQGRLLVTQRPQGKQQAGKWEFPGGKIMPSEGTVAALRRELREELGIRLLSASPLTKIRHVYGDKTVLLDVWRVTAYQGEPMGREGQAMRWAGLNELDDYDFLEASRAIVRALRLPPFYAITDAGRYGKERMAEKLGRALAAGVRLVQLREKRMPVAELRAYTERIVRMCHAYGARVLLNADPALARATGADGVHLESARLCALQKRPLPPGQWVGASCHDQVELDQARRIGVDFAVLSPVKATHSHPQASPLGWERFSLLCEHVDFPVYALGGLKPHDLAAARAAGAQGLAMISGIWDAPSIKKAVAVLGE